MTQKEVHGAVQVRVSTDHQQHPQVSQQGKEVDPQEEHKEQSFDLRVSRKSKEDKFCDGTVVPEDYLKNLIPKNDMEKYDSVFSIILQLVFILC